MRLPTLALPLLVLCSTARADEKEEARAWFVKAKSDYHGGRHAQALEALERAHRLQRLPLLLRYMGDCHRELGHHQKAVKRYRDYLARMPDAADRKEVERLVSTSEAALKAERARAYGESRVPVRLMPTGKDRESPFIPVTPAGLPRDGGRSWLTVSKWAALGVAVGGLAMGITFNRLAAGKADDLEQSMRADCPPGAPGCTGNPNLDRPVVSYGLHHYELQRQLKRYNTVGVVSFVVGGVAAATSAALFWIDRRPTRRESRRVSLAPVLGPGTCGMAGEVSF